MAEERRTSRRNDAPEADNPDAITGAPGSHPVGTGIGAAAAGAAGAAIGSVVPGAGTLIGGTIGTVIGAIAGGLAGKGVAEAINPTAEDDYWRNNYANRPYVAPGAAYDEYAVAYRYGYTAASQLPGREYADVEDDLAQNWDRAREGAKMDWSRAKHATRDAWERVRTQSRECDDKRHGR